MRAILPRVACLVVALVAAAAGIADAGVSPFWQQLGGSATGNGVSQTPAPKAIFDGAVAVGADGKPVVAYTEYPDLDATQGSIVVKRWTGTTWQTLSPAAGVGQGFEPRVRISASGAIYVAWLEDDVVGNREIHLRVRTGPTFDALGGSDSPGGLSGSNAGIAVPFSLALDADGDPVVAFTALAESGIVDVTETPALIEGTVQVYVRRWKNGAWNFLGSGFTGGGASNVLSFMTAGGSTIFHEADMPSLTVDSTGTPVVAFSYSTTADASFINADTYVVRWDGSAWAPVGPAVPTGENPAGTGGPGGVSNSAGGSFNPSIAAGPGGQLALAWEEEPPGGGLFVWVRVWNGASWDELAGSASGTGFSPAGSDNDLPDIAIDPTGSPIVAWQTLLDPAAPGQVFVLRWNGTDAWEEMGFGSASNAGLSDAAVEAAHPSLALTPSAGPASAGVPTVAWLDARDTGSSQVFLRQRYSGATTPLTVTVSGDGSVTSNPIGVECATGTCVTAFPTGTNVTLVPHGGATGAFGSWSGACTGSAACAVALTTPRSVNASFVSGVVVTVEVLSPGGRVSSTPAGITSCTDTCTANFAAGTPVTLTAAVNPGGTFTGWGDACAFRGTNATCALPLGVNASVTASFNLKRFGLTVAVARVPNTPIQGGVGDIGGPIIACAFADGSCSTDVGQGTTVALLATPHGGNRFINWSGGPCNGRTTPECTFPMAANASTTAVFRAVTPVQVLKAGNGTGTVTGAGFGCGADCFESIFSGTSVTLTATPAVGSKFMGWSGDVCAGQRTGPCVFSASGLGVAVSATFQLNKQRLALTPTGAGTGFATSNPVGIDCGTGHATCGFDYDYGTVVTLTPFPGVDSTLSAWSGCTSLNGSRCTVVMTANRTVAPSFVPAHTLAVSASGNGSGRITSTTPPGLTCVSNCSVSQLYPAAASVLLTPQPAVGTNFHWNGGDCSGATACTTPMTANRSAVGVFTLNRHSLTVVNRPSGNVVDVPGGALIDCGNGDSLCATTQDYGTPVTLQATPNAGFVFVSWTGTVCAGSTNRTCAFALKANTSVAPSFRARTLVTVVKSGNGAGTVTGPGISCGADCAEAEFDGKLVLLTATPATGSRFLGFADGCTSNTSTCSFVPTGDSRNVSATFQLIPFSVTVANRANGGAASNALPDGIACGAGPNGGGDCQATLNFGTAVTLQAAPIPGSRFVNWTGDVCAGSTSVTCAFRIPARNISVSPNFKDVTAVTLTKGGQGTIVSSPAGISCGSACAGASAEFARGSVVKLTATPAVGWSFDGFSGDCSGAGCAFVDTSAPAAVIGANFSIQHRRLTVTVVGSGSVASSAGVGIACDQSSTPCPVDFDYGTSVPLTPTPAPGYRFTGWSQECSGVGACTKLMTANHSVTATFKPQFALTVTRTGNSTGTITASPAGISCGLDCSELYLGGTLVTLTRSTPITGTTFLWGGDCAFRGTNATCALTLNANASVSADYSLQRLGLEVIKAGPALGTVTATRGAVVDCGPDCTDIVNYGTPVTLVATANTSPPLAEFVSWVGCTAVSNTSCSFTMTANRTVIATFRPLVAGVALSAISTSPLAVGVIRQVSATASFTDGSQQDVTTQAGIAWTSLTPAIASVNATGLVTGKLPGNTSVMATFRGHGGTLPIQVDTLQTLPAPQSSISVSCSPYGEDIGSDPGLLTCLPSSLSFSVHCQALGTFVNAGPGIDVTDQVTWVSSNAAIAQSTGLVQFNGPIRQSFRIMGNGTAILRATESGKTSPTTGTLGTSSWVVQGVTSTVTALDVTPTAQDVPVGGTAQLVATATLSPSPGCPSPPARDFSRVVEWTSDDATVADVGFLGEVTGLTEGGPVTITAKYGPGNPPQFTPTAQISVVAQSP